MKTTAHLKALLQEDKEQGKKTDGFLIAIQELVFQNEEKVKRAAELVVANKELAFQNQEKEKRASELIVANKELTFQNEEKEKRAAELIIANKELAFQSEEKEKRANELIVANKELAFQNEEKEKRAEELIVANKELIYQNEEKHNRAEELIVANKELVFQSEEKEKRANELVIANKELVFQNQEKENRATELIKTEAQLRAVNEELESFCYSVSHDLRTPLRAIYGYTQILKEDFGADLGSEADRVMYKITGSAKRMGQLIDDLLSFSRIGRHQLQKSKVNMDEMVAEVCKELTMEQDLRSIEFIIPPLLPICADRSAIKQVWVNLISNAVKYSKLKKQTVIQIGCEEKESEIIYHVKDNGAGFDMRYADKLFGVFQRLHSDKEFEGTGAGLAIVQRIIIKHGGRVWGEGKVNEGATFYFTLNKP